jgi:NAD(P)-dependent dehydrogenase (short-subunit alcohol dehydrogenase family)
MNLELKDKVVVITGGAKGIGAAVAEACGSEGAIAVIADRDAEAGVRLQAGLETLGARSHFIPVDLSTPENCASVVQEAVSKFGRLDVLVNNAGRNDKVGLEHGSPGAFVESLGRNLLHYYNMAHFAFPHSETRARIHPEHRLQNRDYRTRRNLGLCLIKRRHPGPDPGMGCGIAALRDSRERHCPGRSDDAPLPFLARHLSQPGGETAYHPVQDSFGKPDDAG